MYPFGGFTDQAKRTLTEAQGEAERSRLNFIGTEHLLLGLIRVSDGLAAMALAELGWDIATARRAIEKLRQQGPAGRPIPEIIPTARVKKVIELAFEEARRTNSIQHVTSGCLLVGLLLEPDGVGSHVLREGGVSVEKVRTSLEGLTADGFRETGGEVQRGPAQTNALQRVISAAEEEAALTGTSVESDHLWRALLRVDSFTTRVLTALGVDPAAALRLVTLPDDVAALVDELEEARADQERAITKRRHADLAAAEQRETALRLTINERFRRWRDTLGEG
jgi:ATP-dependent Clp protease ATP-binding subunit ClpC